MRVVNMPFRKRPFCILIATEPDGAEIVNCVADRIWAEFERGIGLGDLSSLVIRSI